MQYFDPQEIKEKHGVLVALQQRASWDIRSRKFLGLVSKHIPKLESKILDCGCANGALMEQLVEAGYQNLIGTDIDDYRSSSAKQFIFKKADLCMEAMPWPDNTFDAVLSSQTIEHLENPYNFLRESARVLKPKGICIISTPNPFHILNRLLFLRRGNIYHFLEGDNHITFFTRAIFKKTFLKYFYLVEINYGKPELKYKFLNRLSWLRKTLPVNQWFSRYIYYVLKKI